MMLQVWASSPRRGKREGGLGSSYNCVRASTTDSTCKKWKKFVFWKSISQLKVRLAQPPNHIRESLFSSNWLCDWSTGKHRAASCPKHRLGLIQPGYLEHCVTAISKSTAYVSGILSFYLITWNQLVPKRERLYDS